MKTSSIAVETSRSTTQSDSIVRQTNKRSSCLSYTTMNNKHIFKSETKSPCVRITKPSKDLNRYLVDKFNQSTGKSKNAPFEAIDLGIYRPSAKCLAFSTSEDRLLLWVTAFLYRYYEITQRATKN